MVRLPRFTSLRKMVHIGGALFVPLAIYNQHLALAIAMLGTFVFVVCEWLKCRITPQFFRCLYRDHELDTVAYEPLGYLLSITALLALSMVIVPEACYVAIIVMTVGDGFATLVGRSMQGPRLPYSRKTWYGSLAGLILAAATGYLFAGPMAIAGAAGGMAVEAYAGKYDNATTAAAALICAALASVMLSGRVL